MSIKLYRSEHQHLVDRFMLMAGQAVPITPQNPEPGVRKLRAKLILEEALECIRGLGVDVHVSFDTTAVSVTNQESTLVFHEKEKYDIVEVVDGCCDIKVVTTGTLSAFGINDLKPQELTDMNNLAKFGPGGYRRDDGKWIKPPGHKAPDFLGEIIKQGWKF